MTASGDERLAWLQAFVRGVAPDDLGDDGSPSGGPTRHEAALRLYRRLVTQRLLHTVRDFLPRTAARLGRATFRTEVTTFLQEHASQTPYLRDVPGEFVWWATPRWRARGIGASYLADLAHFEALELAVMNAPGGAEAPNGTPLQLDAPLVFTGSARLARYDHAVHQLPRDAADRTAAAVAPTRLLAYRDAADRLTMVELSARGYGLLQALLERGWTVAQALKSVCDARGPALDDEQLARAAELLADLARRGVILGATDPNRRT